MNKRSPILSTFLTFSIFSKLVFNMSHHYHSSGSGSFRRPHHPNPNRNGSHHHHRPSHHYSGSSSGASANANVGAGANSTQAPETMGHEHNDIISYVNGSEYRKQLIVLRIISILCKVLEYPDFRIF